MRRIVLGMLTVLASISAAHADDAPLNISKEVSSRCGLAPLGSVIIEGKAATKDEMERAKVQVERFMTDIDLYQNCVISVAVVLKAKLSEADKVALQKLIDDSQKEKEAVGKEYNEAVDAYGAAHHTAKPSATPKPSATAKPSTPATPAH
jgi:alpha-N-acetylglucosamine transferase